MNNRISNKDKKVWNNFINSKDQMNLNKFKSWRAEFNSAKFIFSDDGSFKVKREVEKMSKSYGNDIGLSDSANDMYGKTLSIPDKIILSWYTLAVDVDQSQLKEVEEKLKDPSTNPMDIKRQLARQIVISYYSKEKANEAESNFNNITVSKGIPEDIQEYKLEEEMLLVSIIHDSGLLSSKSEVRRMIKQSAVRIDGEVIHDINLVLIPGATRILKVGKRRFLKVI